MLSNIRRKQVRRPSSYFFVDYFSSKQRFSPECAATWRKRSIDSCSRKTSLSDSLVVVVPNAKDHSDTEQKTQWRLIERPTIRIVYRAINVRRLTMDRSHLMISTGKPCAENVATNNEPNQRPAPSQTIMSRQNLSMSISLAKQRITKIHMG